MSETAPVLTDLWALLPPERRQAILLTLGEMTLRQLGEGGV